MIVCSCLSAQLSYQAYFFELRVDNDDHSAGRMPLREAFSFKVIFYSGVQVINN